MPPERIGEQQRTRAVLNSHSCYWACGGISTWAAGLRRSPHGCRRAVYLQHYDPWQDHVNVAVKVESVARTSAIKSALGHHQILKLMV
jgi:hypothetical protein